MDDTVTTIYGIRLDLNEYCDYRIIRSVLFLYRIP